MLTEDQILAKVKGYLDQSLLGLEIENLKVDFKSKWYDLSSISGQYEFLKDSSAIVNTYGLDGLIIVGFDEKARKYNAAKFSDCKLRDTSYVMNLLIKRLSHPFDINVYDKEINGNSISIIHIPPAIEKPYVIRNYQKYDKNGSVKNEREQAIFVRKNTGTFPASKYDIDLMYYDRKNVEPDYDISVSLISVSPNTDREDQPFQFSFILENRGRKPFAIVNYKIKYENGQSEAVFIPYKIYRSDGKWYIPHKNFVEIVGSKSIHNLIIDVNLKWQNRPWKFTAESLNAAKLTIELQISNKKNITVEIEK